MEITIEGLTYEIKKVSVIDYYSLEGTGLLDDLEKAFSSEYDYLRQEALLVEYALDSGEKFEFVLFGYELPESKEDFLNMCDDESAWTSDCDVIKTAKEI